MRLVSDLSVGFTRRYCYGEGDCFALPFHRRSLPARIKAVLRNASSSASCSYRAPGGGTIDSQVQKECQDDPEPAPTGHTASRERIDEDIDQGGQRQEEDPKQWAALSSISSPACRVSSRPRLTRSLRVQRRLCSQGLEWVEGPH